MNTLEIDETLLKNSVTRYTYIGCFAADQIPNISHKFPFCMVLNVDPHTLKGSHWISIYCESSNYIEYYDSLGIWPSPSPHIENYLSNYSHIKYSKYPLQSPYSRTCGRHVIFFLFNRCLGTSFDKIVKFLRTSNTSPDIIVNEFVRNIVFKYK
jgi:hypothetical protein